MANFPHLNDSAFPDVGGVDVYKYKNQFDYSRYDHTQMHITLCSVPWDMGEAHIGARTISGIGNVVWFETEAARDAWFAAIPDNRCIRLDTKYKELHRDNQIMLPVPFDVACEYNYIVVEYEPFANDNSLIQYETLQGLDKWFWFIREVEFVSPNTTRVHLMNDAFQTFMYRIHLGGMILERGHAPLFAIDADTYLDNPLANNSGLLAEDVNYGAEPSNVKHTTAHVFNDDTWACIACTSSPTSTWGLKTSEDWTTPALSHVTVDGVPAYRIFAVEVSDLNPFLENIEADYPQFKQTVKGVFFAPKDLINTGANFTFAGTTCYWVSTSRTQTDLLELDKTQFGYGSHYADLAKLYTSPYAHIEITDENGNINVIKIEDTGGTLKLNSCMSLAFPAINIQAHITGYGAASETTLSFANITGRSLRIGGKWYETLHTWEVPVFGLIQSGHKHYDYSTYYDRVQARVALENTYDSAVASANTEKTNADLSADTDYANATNSASTEFNNAIENAFIGKGNSYNNAWYATENTNLNTLANDAITTANNSAASHAPAPGEYGGNAQEHIIANTEFTTQANNFIDATTNAQIDALVQSTAISAASGVLSAGATAAASAATGNVTGAVGAIVGGVINAGAAAGQAAVSANLSTTQAQLAINQNDRKKTTSNTLTSALASNATSNATANTQTTNNLITATNANNALNTRRNANNSERLVSGGSATYTDSSGVAVTETMYGTANRNQDTANANALRIYETARGNGSDDGNIQRTRDTAVANAARTRDTAEKAIGNGVKQGSIDAPFEFGQWLNTGQATVKPLAMIANVITQSKSAIEQAGDEFLRYGYYYNRQWDFDGDWNIGPYFTYWKLKDFWVRGLNVPDMYVDKLRFFLYGGVTVWRRPEDIGNVTIYDNAQPAI